MTFDVEAFRAHFPALSRQEGGEPVVWMDGPGGSQAPDTVIDAMAAVLAAGVSNLGGSFAASREASSIVNGARAAVADLVGATDPDAIAFGPSMTALNLALARAVSRDWGPGDELVVTRLDHDANVSPWLLAAERSGATVRWLDFDPDDGCSLGSIEEVLSSSTRLVAVTAASNAVGTVPDLGEIVGRAREAGAFTVVDAVHHVPHRPTDFADLGADALLCSPYKFYGPHAGVLALAESAWGLAPERIRPAPSSQPGHWEIGTASFEALAGVTAAIEFMGSFGEGSSRRERLVSALSAMDIHTESLANQFLAGIRDMDRITLHGIDDGRPRTPTFAVTVDGHAPADVAGHLGSAGIQVWDGHFYALEVLRRLGRLETGGVVRIGFLAYQTEAEVDRLLEALHEL